MTSHKHIAEYNAFMKWFERTYPELCKMYCLDIMPAVDDTGFIINSKNIDAEMFYGAAADYQRLLLSCQKLMIDSLQY